MNANVRRGGAEPADIAAHQEDAVGRGHFYDPIAWDFLQELSLPRPRASQRARFRPPLTPQAFPSQRQTAGSTNEKSSVMETNGNRGTLAPADGPAVRRRPPWRQPWRRHRTTRRPSKPRCRRRAGPEAAGAAPSSDPSCCPQPCQGVAAASPPHCKHWQCESKVRMPNRSVRGCHRGITGRSFYQFAA